MSTTLPPPTGVSTAVPPPDDPPVEPPVEPPSVDPPVEPPVLPDPPVDPPLSGITMLPEEEHCPELVHLLSKGPQASLIAFPV